MVNFTQNDSGKASQRLPSWMRREKRDTEQVLRLKKIFREKHLHSVCESAGCPNIGECFQKPTATFMILGNTCTRSCRFCGVQKGKPDPVDPEEPLHIAEVVRALRLKHTVITSVTRDDLEDGGAAHFARTVTSIQSLCPDTTTETLIPDFLGDSSCLEKVVQSGVNILNHNVETVPALYPEIRPEADYSRSVRLLKSAKKHKPDLITKSGLMLGLGETKEELIHVFEDLADARCDALTLGQYLAPSKTAVPVREYVSPEMFQGLAKIAESCGIQWVYAGPFVRSSYNAESLMHRVKERSGE